MKAWKYVVLLVTVMASVGCATSGIEAIGKPEGDPKYAKHLVVHNESLAGDITITDMLSRMTGGLIEANVVLRNLTSRDMNVQYRFTWFDADNFEVEKDSRSWIPVILHGHAETSMKAVAPNSSVKSYKVNVREM